jgi:hypothetical protein
MLTPDVIEEQSLQEVSSWAQFACIRSDICVLEQMPLQIRMTRVGLPANLAHIRLDTRMSPHVNVQRLLSGEGLAALVADVLLDIRVGLHMRSIVGL